jgi:hypothetical protein
MSSTGTTHLDLPVFCSDGITFSNRFVIAAASSWIKNILLDEAKHNNY